MSYTSSGGSSAYLKITRAPVRFATAALVALMVVSGSAASQTRGGEVHIGVILPLTGSTAQNGNNALKGTELAAELINKAGGIKSMGGAKIKLDIADATSDPAQAANVATQFLSKGSPPVAILGAYASGLTLTVAQVTERKKIPLLTTSFSDQLVSKGYKYLFQIPPKASVIGSAQMLYASQIAQANGKPIKNAAIVYADNAYGESQNKGLVSQAKTLGINVTIDEAYSPTITDATPVARKVLASKPDVIFSIAYVTDGVLLVRSLKSQGNTAPIVGGTGGYVTADFGSAIGNDANGVLTIDTSDPDVYGAFATEYQKKYGAFPAQEAHDQAAGLYAVVQALEQKPTTDPTVLNETLHSGTFDLAAAGTMPGGKLKWDEAGANSIGKPLMVQWQEGKLVGVWPSELTSHKPIWGH
jgi:branched-chain amino acid transport system substrate-binding protein